MFKAGRKDKDYGAIDESNPTEADQESIEVVKNLPGVKRPSPFIPKTVMFILWLIIISLFDLVWKGFLWSISNNYVSGIQSKGSLTQLFMIHVGNMGNEMNILLVHTMIATLYPYSETLWYFALFTFTLFTSAVLKLLFNEPRPFYASDSVQALSCSPSYGNPSFHAMYAWACFPFIFYLTFHSKCNGRLFISNESMKATTYQALYIFSVVKVVVIIAIVLYSRIYLGAQSLDQVLYGAGLGLAIFGYFISTMKTELDKYFLGMLYMKWSKSHMYFYRFNK